MLWKQQAGIVITNNEIKIQSVRSVFFGAPPVLTI